MNSYQRLKLKNKELERQLRVLVREPNSPEASVIVYSIMFKDEVDRVVMFGGTQTGKLNRGLFDHIENGE